MILSNILLGYKYLDNCPLIKIKNILNDACITENIIPSYHKIIKKTEIEYKIIDRDLCFYEKVDGYILFKIRLYIDINKDYYESAFITSVTTRVTDYIIILYRKMKINSILNV